MKLIIECECDTTFLYCETEAQHKIMEPLRTGTRKTLKDLEEFRIVQGDYLVLTIDRNMTRLLPSSKGRQ